MSVNLLGDANKNNKLKTITVQELAACAAEPTPETDEPKENGAAQPDVAAKASDSDCQLHEPQDMMECEAGDQTNPSQCNDNELANRSDKLPEYSEQQSLEQALACGYLCRRQRAPGVSPPRSRRGRRVSFSGDTQVTEAPLLPTNYWRWPYGGEQAAMLYAPHVHRIRTARESAAARRVWRP